MPHQVALTVHAPVVPGEANRLVELVDELGGVDRRRAAPRWPSASPSG